METRAVTPNPGLVYPESFMEASRSAGALAYYMKSSLYLTQLTLSRTFINTAYSLQCRVSSISSAVQSTFRPMYRGGRAARSPSTSAPAPGGPRGPGLGEGD